MRLAGVVATCLPALPKQGRPAPVDLLSQIANGGWLPATVGAVP
jgi:hypothetical protein